MDLGGHLLWRIGSPFQSIGKMSKSLVFHGESAGLPRRQFFFGKRKLLAGARGKTSLEERFSISKCYCCVILIPGALDPDTNRSMAEPCKVSPPVSPPPKT